MLRGHVLENREEQIHGLGLLCTTPNPQKGKEVNAVVRTMSLKGEDLTPRG